MSHFILGAMLAAFGVLSWMLIVIGPDLFWDLTLLGWALDLFLISTVKAFAS